MKIAFQGVKGCNSEVGLREHFESSIEPLGFDFSAQAFEAVEIGYADCGFIPIENSIAGNVAVNLDLLYKHDFHIIGEAFLPINHCLLVNSGTKLKDIKKIYSHPVALAQCQEFIKRHELIAVPDFDTAGAARGLAERNTHDEAAIAPMLCTEYYGLELLKENLQRLRTNITRFLIFVTPENIPDNLKKEKTSIAFMTKHHPGALVNCLKSFSEHALNLTRIESHPIPENPFAYIFFIDFMGSIDDENVKDCLADMKRETYSIKILGSYPIG